MEDMPEGGKWDLMLVRHEGQVKWIANRCDKTSILEAWSRLLGYSG